MLSNMFTRAIVKTPCKNLVKGISTANLGKPDYPLALRQHQNYIAALQKCDLEVTVLAADEAYPDSCFVEDPALITPECALITRPGATSRRSETTALEAALHEFFPELNYIITPGTLDGGDVMMVGQHFYIGLSDRTNLAGANQLIDILQQHGMTGSTVDMSSAQLPQNAAETTSVPLHLKTGLSYLEHNKLLAVSNFNAHETFSGFDVLTVTEDETYAANCIWINNRVIAPLGFPQTKMMLEHAGYEVITVDVSEFQKLDGGLSCLSLRF